MACFKANFLLRYNIILSYNSAPAIQSEHVLIGLVVLSVAVAVVFVTLTITCRLQLQSLKSEQ